MLLFPMVMVDQNVESQMIAILVANKRDFWKEEYVQNTTKNVSVMVGNNDLI